MIDEFLVSYLQSKPAIKALAEEIAIGQVPVDDEGDLQVDTWIWIEQYSEVDELDLDGISGLTEYHFDCEVCSTDTQIAKRLSVLVKRAMQGHCGVFGNVNGVDGMVQATYVDDKDEDYELRNDFGDQQVTTIALDLTIFADDAQDN
jgi:predicted nucleotidyltransferase